MPRQADGFVDTGRAVARLTTRSLALLAAACAGQVERPGPAVPDDPAPPSDPAPLPGPPPGAPVTEAPRDEAPRAAVDWPAVSDGSAPPGERSAAPPRDGGAVAEAAAAPPNPLTCATARFCDGFESYAADSVPGSPWRLSVTPGATLKVDATRAFGGTRSVRIVAPAGSVKGARLVLTRPLPFPENVVHGRMMIWLAQMPPGEVHWMNVTAEGPMPGGGSAAYHVGGMWQKLLPTYYPPDCWKNASVRYPVGRWFCMQWQFDGSPDGAGGTRDELRVWFDGKPTSVAAAIRTGDGCVGGNARWRAPRFERLLIGWLHAQSAPAPIEMWMDDIAIDTKPIACP